MKRLVAVAVAVSAFVLAGCGAASNDQREFTNGQGGGYTTGWLRVNDNREVFCLFWDRGISCDWMRQR